MEDNDILDLLFQRQEEGLEIARQRYGGRLFRSAMNILHNSEDAEECVNDTLLKAWESIPPKRPDIFSAFLAKITRNLSINKWKSQRSLRRGGGEPEVLLSELEDCIPASSFGAPEDVYDAQLVTEAINACLHTMDETARIAFVLRYFHGESILDICARFDMSESRVKSLLFRARKKLGTHLEKEGIAL